MTKRKAQKPVTFKLHGQPFDPTGSATIFARIGMLQGVLNKCEDGDLMDSAELAAKCNAGTRTVAEYNAKLRESGYAVKIGNKNLYGNQETIAALVKQIDN